MGNPDIRDELELLQRLREVVADFSAREQRMTRGLESRRGGIAWRHQAALEAADTSETAGLGEAERACAEEEARVSAIAAGREQRVRRVAAQALRMLPHGGREARGNWLANLQVRLVTAQNARDAALADAERGAAAITGQLTEECRRLIRLKRDARTRLAGYRAFARKLKDKLPGDETPPPAGAEGVAMVARVLADAEARVEAFSHYLLPRVFQYLPPPLAGGLAVAAGAGVAARWSFSPHGWAIGGGAAAALLAGSFGAHMMSKRHVEMAALALARAVVRADHIYEAARAASTQALEEARREVEETFQKTHAEIAAQWGRVDEIEAEYQARGRGKIEDQLPRLLGRIEGQGRARSATAALDRQARLAHIREEAAGSRAAAEARREAEDAEWQAAYAAEWEEIEQRWRAAIDPLYDEIARIQRDAEAAHPAWDASWIDAWQPPHEFPAGAKFGGLRVDVKALAGALPADPRLALPGPAEFALPLALSFPARGSLLIEEKEPHSRAMETLNALILRLLAASPPGRVSFTIVDPVGLGQNFAGLMYLADYEESLINRRIWTQQAQIEERLAELNEHIEKVIQMYLRNEYATITEYNAKAGSVAEKYHFLVIAGFPAQFSETAARRLRSIALSGPRCGVFTLIQWDARQPLPEGLEDLRAGSLHVLRRGDGYILPGLQPETGTQLVLETPPPAGLAARLVHAAGRASIDSNRVEVPFSQISPAPAGRWTNDTTQELRIAIGRTGATKPQYLAIGKGTRQHALFAGKTGSGKSTLFHVIITNLALSCSPRQVEFYLIDFKKGVEFKCYAEKRLPHARVVAIESDREFALSVLQRVDEELRRRGDLFRKLGVQDLPGYRRAGGPEEIPRTLLIIDEFQEFFVEDDAVAQNASLLFDRIVRQGRAFGIHVLLGSQTLGGAYTLARATLGQMVIRVALQCNEADAYLIMDDNNAAPRLLSRPGEGIYNDAAGAAEGNSPFQVVWLPEEERDRLLDGVHALACERGMEAGGPIVFEGNAPADARDNLPLRALLAGPATSAPSAPRAWLGAPNSIKGPTEAVFHRQSGSNLIIVGQREEAAVSMLGLSLLALGMQHPPGGARFYFFQGTPDGPGPVFIDAMARAIPHEVRIVAPHASAAAMEEIAAELKSRAAGGPADAPVFVFIHGLHKFKKLRREEEFSFGPGDGGPDAAAQFEELIREGASLGMHLLASIDAYGSTARFISRKGIGEFEMRVVFQMSANDSASLIDSPRASALGLHRALFFNEREGSLETFRPYALPAPDWVSEAARPAAPSPSGTATPAGRLS